MLKKRTITQSGLDGWAEAARARAKRRRVGVMDCLEAAPEPGTKLIALTKGKLALVDESDFAFLNQWFWYCMGNGYAARRDRSTRKIVLMHRAILGCPDSFEIDHVNHNGLDNRRCNLRLATSHDNKGNSRKQKRPLTSRFKGVHFDASHRKWQAMGGIRTSRRFLGYFSCEEDAARAYNDYALKYFGEFAYLNPV